MVNTNPDIIKDTNPLITHEGSTIPQLKNRNTLMTVKTPRQFWSDDNNKG